MVSASTRWPGRWYSFEVRLRPATEEAAMTQIQLCGSRGAMTQPAGPGRVTMTTWFDDIAAAEVCRARIVADTRLDAEAGEITPEEDTGWLDASLTPREPIVAGRFRVVDGSDRNERGPGVILLPIGRAFGTGEHETTRLCLELLDQRIEEGMRVFDLGTGSGILAIAAAKGGAREVLALDNDPAVLDVAKENVALNDVEGVVHAGTGSWSDADSEGGFDLVLANIHRTALVRSAGVLNRMMKTGAVAIVSGFGSTDAGLVREAWAGHGFDRVEEVEDGEWTALALSRSGEQE